MWNAPACPIGGGCGLSDGGVFCVSVGQVYFTQVYYTRALGEFVVILSILSIPHHLSCCRGCAILMST